jgi:hypothetical protein
VFDAPHESAWLDWIGGHFHLLSSPLPKPAAESFGDGPILRVKDLAVHASIVQITEEGANKILPNERST